MVSMVTFRIFVRFLLLLTISKNFGSFITRLPCIFYASFNLTPNKYIEGNITAIFIVSDINDCGIHCVRSPTCEFANFNANQKTCQIISSYGNLSKSINDQQWQVLLTDSTNNKNIGPLCENNTPCNNIYCRDTCRVLNEGLTHNYFCSETNKLSKYAIPTQSRTFSNFYPQNLIDSDFSTYGDTFTYDGFSEAWIKLDLKQIFQINIIEVYGDDRNSNSLQRISGCKVQSSFDDTEYQTFAILKGLLIEKYLWNGSLRYFRIIHNIVNKGMSFREITIWT